MKGFRSEIMKILLIRYSSLGDVVISTSVLKAVYEHFPGAQIDFLTDNRYIPVLRRNPYVSDIIGFDRTGDRISEYLRLRKLSGRYDIVFDLQNKLFSCLLSVTFSRGRYFRFSKRHFCGGCSEQHILDIYAGFLKSAGIQLKERRYFISYERKKTDRLIGINIEGGHLSKRLSKSQLFRISQHFTESGFRVLLIGTEMSRTLARDIMCRYKNVTDTTSADVAGLIDIISGLNVLITPDSGPLHLAAALGVPAVAVFGSTSYRKWLPVKENISLIKSDYDCSPCSEYGASICRSMKSFGCIRDISPDIIAGEALRLYEQDKKED